MLKKIAITASFAFALAVGLTTSNVEDVDQVSVAAVCPQCSVGGGAW